MRKLLIQSSDSTLISRIIYHVTNSLELETLSEYKNNNDVVMWVSKKIKVEQKNKSGKTGAQAVYGDGLGFKSITQSDADKTEYPIQDLLKAIKNK